MEVRHPELIALYASAPNHVLGQMVGLPGSHVLLPYVPLYRLRRHRENYCDCVPVLSDEHLSRESRKLTVMMRREPVSCSRGYKSLAISSALCDESVFTRLGVYSTPSSDLQTLGAAPKFLLSKLQWLCEGHKAI